VSLERAATIYRKGDANVTRLQWVHAYAIWYWFLLTRWVRWFRTDLKARILLGHGLPMVSGAIDVPSEQQIAEKYVRVTQGRAQDYTAGITATAPQEFEAAALAAADTWAAGVTQAVGEQRFAMGLQGSGARWRRKAEQLGSQRFPSGVAGARDDMASGVAPYVQELRSITLDPRRPRGDPANLQRVAVIAQRLNARRRAGVR